MWGLDEKRGGSVACAGECASAIPANRPQLVAVRTEVDDAVNEWVSRQWWMEVWIRSCCMWKDGVWFMGDGAVVRCDEGVRVRRVTCSFFVGVVGPFIRNLCVRGVASKTSPDHLFECMMMRLFRLALWMKSRCELDEVPSRRSARAVQRMPEHSRRQYAHRSRPLAAFSRHRSWKVDSSSHCVASSILLHSHFIRVFAAKVFATRHAVQQGKDSPHALQSPFCCERNARASLMHTMAMS